MTNNSDNLARGLALLLGVSGLLILLLEVQNTIFNYQPVVRTSRNPMRAIARISEEPVNQEQRLVVDLSDRRVYLYSGLQLETSYSVGIGKEGWETPTGFFRIDRMQRHPKWRHPITGKVFNPGAENPLGSRWIGFWSDEKHQIGFHGTTEEELIGSAISHGCLRMRDRDIQKLFDRVSLGTVVVVRQ